MDQPLFLVLSISASIKRQQSCTGVLELMSPARDRRIMVLLYFDLKNQCRRIYARRAFHHIDEQLGQKMQRIYGV